jgi:hypothetical protein
VTRRLLARRKLDPTHFSCPGWVETYGPEVCDVATLAGFPPDPEQQLILDGIFAIGRDAKSVVFETDVAAPRQQLKTGVVKQAELGWLYVTEERLIVHSAHELDSTEEAFLDLRLLIENTPALSRRLEPTRGRIDSPGVSTGNGSWVIELRNNQRLKYKARTKGGGRGLTGNKVVLDEAQHLLPAHMGSLLPTLTVVPDPQLLLAGSAGHVLSSVWRDARNRGRKGTDPRQLWAEWCDPHPWTGCKTRDCTHAKTAIGCALDDERRWAKFMSQLGKRARPETIRSLRQSMPPLEFAREFMMWWEDPPGENEDDIFGGQWAGLALEVGPRPDVEAIGVAVELDRAFTSIGAAGTWADGRINVGAVDRRRGTDWVVEEVQRIQRMTGCIVIVDGRGPGADLIKELQDAGVFVVVAATDDVLTATAGFFDAVDEETVTHMDDDWLNEAIAGAVKRYVGDRFAVGRKKSMTDVSMLEAVELAHWGVAANPVPEISLFRFDDLDNCDACREPIDREVDDDDYRCTRCIEEGRPAQ